MLDKFMKAAKVKSEEEFLAKYPTEEAFFKAFPKFKNGGNIPKAKGGMKVSSERWDPNLQMWVLDEGLPAKQIQPQKVQPFSMMENPYAGVFNEQQSPTFYKPYNQVNYDGILTPNYMRTEFNPQTNKWDKVNQVDMVELQPQYTGDWSNAQRKSFEAQQPSQIGAYKTTKGKRKSRYNTEYDDMYEKGGHIPVAENGFNWGQYSYYEQPTVPTPYTSPQQYKNTKPVSNTNMDQAQSISGKVDKVANFMNNISDGLQSATKNIIMGGNALAMNVLGPTQRDERLDRPYQKPVSNQFAYGTGSQAIAKNGVSIPYENGGTLDNTTIHKGGNAELISYNPYTPETIQYNGQSHDNGGITIDYNGTPVEVEGGETQTGNVVFGNMKIPGTNTKFKDASKQLAKEEQKASKILSKGEELLSIEPINAYRTLKTNTGKILTELADKKLQEAAKTKQELSLVQDIMLKGKEQTKMKHGGKIKNPIYTTDKNDPRLQMYNDSLNLYNAYKFQKSISEKKDSDYSEFYDNLHKYQKTSPDSFKKEKNKKIFNSYEEYKKAYEDFDKFTQNSKWTDLIKKEPYKSKFAWTEEAARFKNTEDFKKLGIDGDYKKIKYYESLKFSNPKDVEIGRYSSADLIHDKIKPIGSYWGGKGFNPIYKKPVQPYIYQSRPQEQVSYLTPNGIQQLPSQEVFSNPEFLYGEQIVPYRETTTYYPGGPVNWEEKGVRIENKKYKNGGEIEIAKHGWKFNNTSYEGVDSKIKKFVQLVEEKGYTGYSGPKSGVSQRNTKSGRKSRHAIGDALDMMFDDPTAYGKILKDKELTTYLYQNGLTVIDEYDPNIAKKTGATVGHLHVGFDKGTPTADKFRHDAALFHPELKNKKPPFIPKPYKGSNTVVKGAPVGDVHDDQIPLNSLTTPPALSVNNTADFSNWYTQQFQPNVYNQDKQEDPFKGPSNFDYLKSIGNPTISPEPSVKKLPSLADKNKLSFADIAPEIGTLLSNIQGADFVQGQEYNPTLYTPYQVSFQDRINENNAQLKAMERMVPNNPSALSTLAAQAYQANNAVLADQFRTNQGIVNDVINNNVGIINDAEMKNITLRDQQYARQAQAEANTRNQIFDAMSSISNKYSKNKKENVDIRLKETMFPNYRPSEDGKYEMEFNGEKWVIDPSAQTMTPLSKKKQEVTEDDKEGNKKTKTTYEKSNNMINKKWGEWI